MTATFVPTVDPTSSITTIRSSKRSLGLAGLGAGAVAGAATMVVAAIAQAADVSLKLNGAGGHPAQPIPLGGFGTMTLAGAAVGILIAAGARRWTQSPAVWFVRLAVIGTVLSLIPDAVSAADTPTMLVLWLTHFVAAAIIVSALAVRLRNRAVR
jgi:Family of unknown function (DUF6069)